MAENAADINRSIFNDEASSYDEKHRKATERLTQELQSRLDFIGVDWASEDEDSESGDEKAKIGKTEPKREVRLLDYACGTGTISRALAPYTTQCVGIDVSEKMVAVYNTRAENQGISPEEMHAITGDLVTETVSDALSSPELFNFDIAAVGGGFHHFGDPALAAKRLVERLRPGGVLLIWDFLPHEPWRPHNHQHGHQHGGNHNHGHSGHSHGHGEKAGDEKKQDVSTNNPEVIHSVMHHGFSESRIKEIFEAAGAGTDFGLETIGGGFLIGHGKHDHGHHHQHGQQWIDEGDNDGAADAAAASGQGNDDAFYRRVFFARGTKGPARVDVD